MKQNGNTKGGDFLSRGYLSRNVHIRLDKTALFAVGTPQLKARPDFYNYIIWHSSKGIQNLEREQLPEVFHTEPE